MSAREVSAQVRKEERQYSRTKLPVHIKQVMSFVNSDIWSYN